MKQVTGSNLKQKWGSKEYKSLIILVERQVETKGKVKKPYGIEKSCKEPRIEVLTLINELKNKFKEINELAREIGQKDGRTIVTYNDAEEAIKLVKLGKTAFENGMKNR